MFPIHRIAQPGIKYSLPDSYIPIIPYLFVCHPGQNHHNPAMQYTSFLCVVQVYGGAMEFQKPLALPLGPLPLWFLALWANFGCVAPRSAAHAMDGESQKGPVSVVVASDEERQSW